MKTMKSLVMVTLSLSAMMFFSCSDNDDPQSNENMAVRFTGVINEAVVNLPQTRAAGTAWAANDPIGIFMLNGDLSVIDGNKMYRTENGNGNFEAEEGHSIYYPMSGENVSFIAYHPYVTTAMLDNQINIIIGEQTTEKQPDFDVLHATAQAVYNKAASAPVPLAFHHKMSKIVLNCKVAANVTSSVTSITPTIEGMNSEGMFNLRTGKVTATSATTKAIYPRKITPATGFIESYDAIILPGEYAAGTIEIKFLANNDTYIWNAGEVTFEEGNEYIYNVTLTRTEVVVDTKIEKWTPNTTDINAD